MCEWDHRNCEFIFGFFRFSVDNLTMINFDVFLCCHSWRRELNSPMIIRLAQNHSALCEATRTDVGQHCTAAGAFQTRIVPVSVECMQEKSFDYFACLWEIREGWEICYKKLSSKNSPPQPAQCFIGVLPFMWWKPWWCPSIWLSVLCPLWWLSGG